MTRDHKLRGEIQGLRAVAVSIVLLFHIWPDAMPGGYVGVDVFFVISGYLIVGSLTREAERDGRISLPAFYARRIRRLLPAASVVLASVLLATFVWLPPAWWEDTLIQIGASAIYVENWYLAWAAVDYLAAENAPSPVQHYWSLSIEEQFYIVWPVVMLAVMWFCRRRGAALRPQVGIALGLVFTCSLAASVTLTPADPGRAYFVTHTRAWELALGGLLAVVLPRITAGQGVRAVLCLAGLVAIVVSGLSFSDVAFPGYAALLPTLGAAAVILAGDVRIGPFRGLNMAPLRYLGDISYSLYLWHWPLIVFFVATGNEVGFWQGLLLIAASVAVSHVSYRHVEERFRHPASTSESQALGYGLASILGILAVGAGSHAAMVGPTPSDDPLATNAARYPGPAALIDGAPTPEGVPIVPVPTQLTRDRSVVYDNGCHQDQNRSDAPVCEFGDPNADVAVAVVGSSHSVNWLPAVDVLGRKNGWKVYSVTKSSCNFRQSGSESCDTWHDNVLAFLRETSVDAVFLGEMVQDEVQDFEEALIAERLARISDVGIPILAIRPTPQLTTRPGDCLPDNVERCVIPRAEAERENLLALAAATVPGVYLIDMNDAICGPQTCSPVVGNLAVFRDAHHLTATYSRALAPYLDSAIDRTAPGLLPRRDDEAPVSVSFSRGPATLNCGSTGDSEPLTRSFDVILEGARPVLRRGDWQTRNDKFEEWSGEISGGTVSITGEYSTGGAVKHVELKGRIEGGVVVAQGTRGPRQCSLTWPLDREQLATLGEL